MVDILLVEDQEELVELMCRFLEKAGYKSAFATNGEKALEFIESHETKLILLDIMLPKLDGLSVCRQIRKKKDMPILILSARSDKEAKINAYELGADDYVEKPIDMDILLAKIKVLFKRYYEKQVKQIITSGGITLNKDAMQLQCDGIKIALSVKEYELLLLLMEHEGKTLSKNFIFQKIWGIESESEYQTLTVHIKMLRDKIERDSKDPKRIKTVWGVGYRYEKI